MGGGSYSYSTRVASRSDHYITTDAFEIFSKSLHKDLSPKNIEYRESCDSEEHPESFPIIIGLDVTGSMGDIPDYLIKSAFPEIMKKLIDSGISNPQVLFLGIGDHKCDSAPIQISQFESSDELLDKQLEKIYIEGGGGGNGGESYLLAWYVAAFKTRIDSFIKRNKKGVCITIGDEPNLLSIDQKTLKNIFKQGEYRDYSDKELLEEAKKYYECYHIDLSNRNKYDGSRSCKYWENILCENVIFLTNTNQVIDILSQLILSAYNKSSIETNSIISSKTTSIPKIISKTKIPNFIL